MVSSLQKGIKAAKSGHMQEALDFLKDAIIEEPQNADVWVWVAAIIDDLDKQEIFLKKALEIDPQNIPAQRGMAYLQKRKRDQIADQNDHLSDHTSPISPFPPKGRPDPVKDDEDLSKLELDEINKMAASGEKEDGKKPEKNKPVKSSEKLLKDLPKLSAFEIVLLGVVVVVFAFIGILAASAIFDFDLPINALSGSKAAEGLPPYAGVFLFENDLYSDIQQHQGLPSQDVGIPTSQTTNPTIVIYTAETNPETLNLIYETGEYISFNFQNKKNGISLLHAESELNPGLYCFQQLPANTVVEAASYWCFKVEIAPAE
ncbi:tetratricopeptide repeat protein [Chloroflexota bacterium]|nr:tetratricopeptide repeat protein [Chloroflexota bacterium]